MVSGTSRVVPDARCVSPRLARLATILCLMSIGAAVCISLAACGGRDSDSAQDSSATSNAATPQSDSPTIANAANPASNGLLPPVMHYAQ